MEINGCKVVFVPFPWTVYIFISIVIYYTKKVYKAVNRTTRMPMWERFFFSGQYYCTLTDLYKLFYMPFLTFSKIQFTNNAFSWFIVVNSRDISFIKFYWRCKWDPGNRVHSVNDCPSPKYLVWCGALETNQCIVIT